MSNVMRWRWGETAPVVSAVDKESEIFVGDLLWLDNGRAKPASALAPAANPGSTRESFARQFLGVAMQYSPAGEERPIRVATRGVFELETSPGTFQLGDWVGVAIHPQTGRPISQQVEKVTAASQAIGRVASRVDRPASKVLVEICSTVMAGGVAGTTAPA